ncbi:MAG: hypothetical protein ABL964_10050 [Steroidobacteraceae bacterium]
MSLADLPATPVSVASLSESGLLPGEIAAALGLPLGDVLARLPEPWVSPALVSRSEAALFSRAIGGTTWRDVPDKTGGTMRLESELLPDVAAAKAVLAAHKPALYGQDATPPIRVVVNMMGALPDPVSVLEDVTPR